MSDASERRLATAWDRACSTADAQADFLERYPDLYFALLHWQASNGRPALASAVVRRSVPTEGNQP